MEKGSQVSTKIVVKVKRGRVCVNGSVIGIKTQVKLVNS